MDQVSELSSVQGAFVTSLKRNNTKIRDDRAVAIVEDSELHYRRGIEDLITSIKTMKRDRDNMLDLSPTHADSLVLASDFNAKAWVDKDLELGFKIDILEKKLVIAKERYEVLFGKEVGR